MLRFQCLALCFLAYYTIGASAGKVSFIKPCKPNDYECIKASVIAATPYFIKGIPELGLPPAEPLVLHDVRSDDKDLKLGFRNLKVTGMSKCKLLDFKRDLDKSSMTLTEECPISATGQYDLDGKLFLVHATGDGDFKIDADLVRITVTLLVKIIEKEGVKHWKITGFDYDYDIKKKAKIELHNLFDGDETRAKPIRDILENSSNELIKAVGGDIIKELLSREAEIVNNFFKAVPLSELQLDP